MNVLPIPERTGPEREWKRETGGTTLHTEYKLVFSRALTRIQCPVVWSNTSQDMAAKIFLQTWLIFKSIDFEKSRFLSTAWMGLIQSVEGLKNKEISWGKSNSIAMLQSRKLICRFQIQDCSINFFPEFVAALQISGLRAPTTTWAISLKQISPYLAEDVEAL